MYCLGQCANPPKSNNLDGGICKQTKQIACFAFWKFGIAGKQTLYSRVQLGCLVRLVNQQNLGKCGKEKKDKRTELCRRSALYPFNFICPASRRLKIECLEQLQGVALPCTRPHSIATAAAWCTLVTWVARYDAGDQAPQCKVIYFVQSEKSVNLSIAHTLAPKGVRVSFISRFTPFFAFNGVNYISELLEC